jgi:hypothetical protein
MATIQEFAQRVKEKYPQYQNIDDTELTNRIIEKYPVYKDKVDFNIQPAKSQTNEDIFKTNVKKNQPDIDENALKQVYSDIKNARAQAIVEASKYDVPRKVVEGMFDRGEFERLNQFAKDAAMVKGIQNELPNSGLEKFSNTVFGAYDVFKNLPGIKQASQTVGGVVGGTGAAVGGLVGGLAQIGVESYKKLSDLVKGSKSSNDFVTSVKNIYGAAKSGVTETAKFGYESGKEAVPLALLPGAGKIAGTLFTGAMGIEGGKNIGQGIEEKNSEKIVSGVATLGMGLLGGRGLASGKVKGELFGSTGLKNQVASEVGAVKNLFTTGAKVDGSIVSSFNTAIKPSITNKGTSAKAKQYDVAVSNVVKDIVENRDKIQIKDESGEVVRNGVPETVAEFESALNQRKKQIYSEYSELNRQAGEKGKTINYGEKLSSEKGEESILDALDIVIQDKNANLYDPQAVEYAKRLKQNFEGEYNLSLEESQSQVEYLNDRLKTFFRNPDTKELTRSKIDAMISNKLRELMDNKITEATGEGYQALRNKYAEIKRIEKDVRRKANLVANKNGKTLIDFADIISGADVISGIVSMNPAQIVRGGIMYGIKETFKSINSPDANIKRMFKGAENKALLPGSILKKTVELGKDKPVGLSLKDVSKNPLIPKPFKNFEDLSTKILGKLEGKTTVSKQFISDLTNSGDLKQVERDIIREALKSEGDKVNVSEFAEKVKRELLPLERRESGFADSKGITRDGELRNRTSRYESISLPTDLRGNVANYTEQIYESPIKTSAGNIHFGGDSMFGEESPGGYFGHTRVEDMAKKDTRRVIEVQSDLYQKGNLEKEMNLSQNTNRFTQSNPDDIAMDLLSRKSPSSIIEEYKISSLDAKSIRQAISESPKTFEKLDNSKVQKFFSELDKITPEARKAEASKLQQYNNPTAHFRMVREEVKQATIDGKTKLQFPTGETAMKIEGLGNENIWNIVDDEGEYINIRDAGGYEVLKVGDTVSPGYNEVGPNGATGDFVITDILGDGKFKAVPKESWDKLMAHKKERGLDQVMEVLNNASEQFDISGKIDTNNPIFRFYEKTLGNYLKSKYKAELIKDKQGVWWYEVKVDPKYKNLPVEAFGLLLGAGLSSLLPKKKD